MKLVSISQMQKADNYTIKSMGIPGRTLMYNAASSIAEEVLGMSSGKREFSAAVFCGPGNNGGDGWATALILNEKGIDVSVFTGCAPSKLKGDAFYYASLAIEKEVRVIDDLEMINTEDYDVVIDALFGIGLGRKLDGVYKEAVLAINNKARRVISVDVPSGLHSDEGIPFDYAVRADMTVTFGRAKTMLVSQPGCIYSGELIVADIGIPDEAYIKENIEYFAVDSAFIRERVKPREKISSKGTYGRVLLVTGSPGMTGATGLCAEACLRSGSGLVYCAVPKSKVFEYDSLVREAISIPVEDGGKPFVSADGSADIIESLKNKSAIVIGPGLSVDSNSHEIFSRIMESTDVPVIVDAQALNDLSLNKELLQKTKPNTILTPHPGEMSRLTGNTIDEIQDNRIGIASGFAREYGVIVLLKGHRTVVTDGTRVFVNTTGNPGMASAGSGDVLCGVIASCTAYISDTAEAVATAAYIHGAAGDRASVRYGEYSMKSGDIISEIPWVMKNIAGV
ncbi:MAG: NAD(P)H-hydrate dehydratase [Clostridia bacterium]|nr:NAD(P)H-hydrate dehydratase [Clostridia bacterium]